MPKKRYVLRFQKNENASLKTEEWGVSTEPEWKKEINTRGISKMRKPTSHEHKR